MSDVPFGNWAADLLPAQRARALAALGTAQAHLSAARGAGATDPDRLKSAFLSVVEDAGADGSAMVSWKLTTDPNALPVAAAGALADLWATHSDRLRRSVRPEDPKPLRFEIARSRVLEPHLAWLSAQLHASTEWPVGVHVLEAPRARPPRWHWPIRVYCLGDPRSRDLANRLAQSWPTRQGLAEILAGRHSGPAEFLILPWSLEESALRIARIILFVRVACVVVLGGGQDLPWPRLRLIKENILAKTGAAGLYITNLDLPGAAYWFDQPLGFNLDHNYQLDVCIERETPGLFFATSELLAVSQLSNQILAMADGFADLPGNPDLEVPAGLGIPPGRLPARDLAREIREKAPTFKYEHESEQAAAAARAGVLLDRAEAEAPVLVGVGADIATGDSVLLNDGVSIGTAGRGRGMRSTGSRPGGCRPTGSCRGGFCGRGGARPVARGRASRPPRPARDGAPRRAPRTRGAPPTAAPFHRVFGKLAAPDRVVEGVPFELEIGLIGKRPVGVAGGAISLPGLTATPYAVDVQLVADTFNIDPGESFQLRLELSTTSPFPSRVVHLTPRPQAVARTTRTIHVTFGLGGETLGVAIRTIDVIKNARGARPTLRQRQSTTGITAATPTGERPADLTIEIFVGDSGNALRWSVRSGLPGVRLAGNSAIRRPLLGSPKEFQAEVKLAVESDDGSGSIGQVLVGIGRNVSRAIPPQVWSAIRRASKAVGGRPLDILILSEEPYVPWELAVPEPPLTADVAPFLGAQANVGRWLLGEPPPAPAHPRRVVAGSIAAIKGSYPGPNFERLPGASKEVSELRRLYQAVPIPPKMLDLRELLDGRPKADVIHFAVHGTAQGGGAGDDGLVIAETAAGLGRVAITPFQVEGATLAKDAGAPFVFLNACQVGEARQSLAMYSGLAAGFVRWGASAVVAPIWAIDDSVSHEIALGIYARALGDVDPPPIASLLREARLRFDPDAPAAATFVAYQLYGHPSMRLVRPTP